MSDEDKARDDHKADEEMAAWRRQNERRVRGYRILMRVAKRLERQRREIAAAPLASERVQ